MHCVFLGVACICLDSFDETKNMRENKENYDFNSYFEMMDGGLLERENIMLTAKLTSKMYL